MPRKPTTTSTTKPKTKAKSSKKAPAASSGKDKLASALAGLNKVFKKGEMGIVELDSSSRTESHPHLPTGSLVVDYLIGGTPNENGVPPCPGLPRGRLVNLYGHESSGKTTLALTAAATTIRHGGQVCFVDWEHAIDLNYAEALGVPKKGNKFMLSQPEDLETGLAIVYLMAKAGVELVIIDSVSAGIPRAQVEQSIGDLGKDQRVGLTAKRWSENLPRLKALTQRTGTCILGISQLRDNIKATGYGDGKVTAGGNSWKFYSELRLMLKRIKSLKAKEYNPLKHKVEDRVIGGLIRARVDKCKVAPTQQAEAEFYIRFGEGIDDVGSIMDIAMAHGIISKAGSWLEWARADNSSIRAQGVDKFREALLSTEGAWPELYKVTLRRVSAATGDGMVSTADEEIPDLSFITGADPKEG